jgi:Protein of unknown function (DUF3108)
VRVAVTGVPTSRSGIIARALAVRRLRLTIRLHNGLLILPIFMAACAPPATAQGNLKAQYVVSLAGVTIGAGTWMAEIGEDAYTTEAKGGVAGILRVFGHAKGSAAAQGIIKDGRLVPTSYASHLISEEGDEEVRMLFDVGVVTELTTEPPSSPDSNSVPVTEADRHGVIDPISAGLIPVVGNGDLVSAAACERTLPVFDGRQRFDVALAFKRMDKVHPEKGYQGPAVVCAVRYEPRAGYRPNRTAVKFLIARHDVEMWLVPITGTRLLVPARISIPTLVGTAVVAASEMLTDVAPAINSTEGRR